MRCSRAPGLHLLLCMALLHAWLGAGQDPIEEYLSTEYLVPEPRKKNVKWNELHEMYAREIALDKEQGTDVDLMVWGDSILETFRGSSFGKHRGRYNESMEAWDTLIESKYSSGNYAISGDTTMYLLWRLQNGGGPAGTNVKVATVLIGANDIGRVWNRFKGSPDVAARATFLGVKMVLEELNRQVPWAKLAVLGLLPLQPHGIQNYQWMVDSVNQQLEQYAEEQPHVHYIDCGSRFFLNDGSRVANMTLIPDGIHPRGPGAWILAQCCLDAADQALQADGSSSPLPASSPSPAEAPLPASPPPSDPAPPVAPSPPSPQAPAPEESPPEWLDQPPQDSPPPPPAVGSPPPPVSGNLGSGRNQLFISRQPAPPPPPPPSPLPSNSRNGLFVSSSSGGQ